MVAILGSTFRRVKDELRALTFPPRAVTSRAAAPRVIAAAHPGVLLHSDANVDAHRLKSPRGRQSPRGKFAACKSEVVACSVTCFLFSL